MQTNRQKAGVEGWKGGGYGRMVDAMRLKRRMVRKRGNSSRGARGAVGVKNPVLSELVSMGSETDSRAERDDPPRPSLRRKLPPLSGSRRSYIRVRDSSASISAVTDHQRSLTMT
jgi:hypothetical protein